MDKLDIKIKEAADHYEPAYDEKAWSKMEKLLDKNMPQNKRNKRRILWLFLLLFIIAGSFFYLRNFIKNSKEEKILLKENTTGSFPSPTDAAKTLSKNEQKNLSQTGNKTKRSPSTVSRKAHQARLPKKYSLNNKRDLPTLDNSHAAPTKWPISGLDDYTTVHKAIPGNGLIPGTNYTTEHRQISKNEEASKEKSKSSADEKNINNELPNDLSKSAIFKETRSLKKEKKFRNSFSVTLSAGPDVSAVNLNNAGKIEPVFGVGMSYAFARKWSIKSGIFFEKKVYEAAPSDYHAPPRFINYFPDLKNIEADCKIIELPLVVNYHFSESQHHSWFAAAGISSFLMKTEDYDYLSKNASGQNSYYNYIIHNKNEHFLSSIRLSAGYQRKLSNNLSILAEPYANLPLSGVGYGKVKLFSAGILFTISVKPFAKK